MRLVVRSAIFIAAMSFCLFSTAFAQTGQKYRSLQHYYDQYVKTHYPRIGFRLDFIAAYNEARRTKKPLLVYYTAGAGCHGCVVLQNGDLMNNPRVYETMRDKFVPVLVYKPFDAAEFERQPADLRKLANYLLQNVRSYPGLHIYETRVEAPKGQAPQVVGVWSPSDVQATGLTLERYLNATLNAWRN